MEPPPPPDHHFAPIDPHMEPFHDFVDDRFVEDPVHYEERIPNVQQRLDRMSLDGDVPEIRPRVERHRFADMLPLPQDYLYYRLSKRGDDWSSCVKKPIPAPIDEIERKAKKSKGGDAPILEQLTKMPTLRRDMLDEVIRKANHQESGDAYWEVVYIKSKKIQTRRGKTEVPEMDVILARTKGRTKSRTKSSANSGERVKREVVKEKKYISDSYGRVRKDSVLDKLEDPVANLPVFEADGRPRDDLGPMHFNNSNLPPHIAREMPLGTNLEKKKEKVEKRKSRSRSKSRERGLLHHQDGVFVVPDVHDFAGESADPTTVDGMLADEPMDRRGRRGQSPHEHPVVIEDDHRRSHSRHRPDGRSKSRPRKESVHFPNGHTRQYFDAADGSSENSDTSHYGFVGDHESSTTSISTHGAIPRRGSLVRGGRPDVEYKKHHPGPNRRLSYQEKPYHGEQHVILPARPARRDSNVIYHERPPEVRYERPYPRLTRRETAPPIPEDHQILYHEPLPRTSERDLVPLRRSYTAREPILHQHPRDDEELYYRDELDRQSYRAEGYQRDRVIEDHFNRRELELSARERELEIREDELRQLRRQRERELERDRDYFDDRDVRKERRESRQIFYDPKTGQANYYND